jgi:hypothetical protein
MSLLVKEECWSKRERSSVQNGGHNGDNGNLPLADQVNTKGFTKAWESRNEGQP